MTDEPVPVAFTVNGSPYDLRLPARRLLSDALRHDLRLTGTHVGCEHGVCGACTVLVDGQPMRSCLLFAVSLDGAAITTVEGCRSDDGGMGPVQQAFQDCHALQCGFCTPGFITTITAYLAEHPSPTEDEAREAIAGNLCRCTGYQNIVAAVLRGAELMSAAGPTPSGPTDRASGPTPAEAPDRASRPTPSGAPGPAAAPEPSGASRLPPGPATGAAARPGSPADVSSGASRAGSSGDDLPGASQAGSPGADLLAAPRAGSPVDVSSGANQPAAGQAGAARRAADGRAAEAGATVAGRFTEVAATVDGPGGRPSEARPDGPGAATSGKSPDAGGGAV